MSILKKPYEITVWQDVWVENLGKFEEQLIAPIGSYLMTDQGRALEPNLTRNVNGQTKFSFKMYKYYTDIISGERIQNPYVDYLINERKVKLKVGGDDNPTWYDFIITDIDETSTNYLYVYHLEDAWVHELAKNGFNVVLDSENMNNMNTSVGLAEEVLKETDWKPYSEVAIQTVEEPLVYLITTEDIEVTHLIDQVKNDEGIYATGVTEEPVVLPNGSRVLGFYSSCTNKPHRFQFIYCNNGNYNKNNKGEYVIDRNDDRLIREKDCQYYKDFTNPETDYIGEKASGEDIDPKNYGLFIPNGFKLTIPAFQDNNEANSDSQISTWYRGARYGFSQQSEYIPLLGQYCQKFQQTQKLTGLNNTKLFLYEAEGISSVGPNTYEKKSKYSGIYFDLQYEETKKYTLEYDFILNSGTLNNIGDNNWSFATERTVTINRNPLVTLGPDKNDRTNLTKYSLTPGESIHVKAIYEPNKEKLDTDATPYIFIIPNKGSDDEIDFSLSNVTLTIQGENYYGYTESKFVSPTTIRNYITNYKFESDGGWIASSSDSMPSDKKPFIESAYGRFDKCENPIVFHSIKDDFLKNIYSSQSSYSPYMKFTLYDHNQFILNSGIKDNRYTIKMIPKLEEWVLDCFIVDENEVDVTENFTYSLCEYKYDSTSNIYKKITGNISFKTTKELSICNDEQITKYRQIFQADSTNYRESTFKNSSIYLQIIPKTSCSLVNSFYIKHISLYQKYIATDVQGNEKIIYPDYEKETDSKAIEEWVSSSKIQNTYQYFKAKYVTDGDALCSDKKDIPLVTKQELSYDEFVPVYNTGAEKVRAVTEKESNYFNILQSIAETFEQWMIINVDRNLDGSVREKQIWFKNYRGEENYACFRYGVNLKDISRTYSSQDIVTKLIVKQNANELATDGMCTIQRAGSNPSGENYLYDFQYYQNKGLMDVDAYLSTVYYLKEAYGPDHIVWGENGVVKENSPSNPTNINGYYLRLKKLNNQLLDINEKIIGLQGDLVARNAELTTAEALLEASTSSLQEAREDFYSLTDLFPEEIQDGMVKTVDIKDCKIQEDWLTTYIPETGPFSEKYWIHRGNGKIEIDTRLTDRPVVRDFSLVPYLTVTDTILSGGKYEVTKNQPYGGLAVNAGYSNTNAVYELEYDLTVKDGKLLNIGCHNSAFIGTYITDKNEKKGFTFEVYKIIADGSNEPLSNAQTGDSSIFALKEADQLNDKYKVKITGITYGYEGEQDKRLWIQPNRGTEEEISFTISNVKLSRILTGARARVNEDRDAHLTIIANITLDNGRVLENKTFQITATIPKKNTTYVIKHEISFIDTTRKDVQEYLAKYVLCKQKVDDTSKEIPALQEIINTKTQSIQQLQKERDELIKSKQTINEIFFRTYSRFIKEGTWIDEEYIDDEKYYIDSQSVLYNSCFPQVVYNINVLELSALPEYKDFVFELGEKTWVIDDEFFGENVREEVIISEFTEYFDEPDKNKIAVQNFKNQFQDLFQKITATVQQTEYNVGAYEEGSAFLHASAQKKSEFITKAINNAASYLNSGQTVTSGPEGITITDINNPKNSLRLVAGAILFGVKDNADEVKWCTGLTSDGISAHFIKAGQIDTQLIQICAADEPCFRWDEYGISAFDAIWSEGFKGEQSEDSVADYKFVTGINSSKFVRFDKHGIYGIDNEDIIGKSWRPESIDQIDQIATFALTWEGLKVTQPLNEAKTKFATARIGNYSWTEGKGNNAVTKKAIIKVNNGEEDTLLVDSDGNLSMKGHIEAISGKIGNWGLENGRLTKFGEEITIGEQKYYNNSFCMQAPAETNGNVIAIGQVQKDNWDSANFRVTKQGDLLLHKKTASATIEAATGALIHYQYGVNTNFSLKALERDEIFNETSQYLNFELSSYNPGKTIMYGGVSVTPSYRDFGTHNLKMGLRIEERTYPPDAIYWSDRSITPVAFLASTASLVLSAQNDIIFSFGRKGEYGTIGYSVKLSEIYQHLFPDIEIEAEEELGALKPKT